MAGAEVVIENIRSRRSIRRFKEDPVPRGIIEKIVEAGRFAPSALNRQPWKFIILQEREFIKKLSCIVRARLKMVYRFIPVLKLFSGYYREERVVSAIKKTAQSSQDTVFYNAPLLIFIANDTRKKNTAADCCLAAQNMLLAAHALGIGGCFIGRGKAIPKKVLQRKFNLPAYYHINVYLVFGYPMEFPKTPPVRRGDTVLWA